jgi:hypothetical protein
MTEHQRALIDYRLAEARESLETVLIGEKDRF